MINHVTRLSLVILLPYLSVHVVAAGAICFALTWRGVAIALASYAIRTVALGASYHRYFAHRSFRTSRPMQLALALAGCAGLEGGPLWWADTHRRHHRHADTPQDLHSPRHHGVLYAHAGWFADAAHQRTDLATVADLARYPELVWLDRHYRFVITAFVGLMYLSLGVDGLVWGVAVSSVMVWQATHCIQSLSHMRGGYRRCPTNDDSRNHFVIALATFGEWHNNHHYAPSSARQGFEWWEIDVVYYCLKGLEAMGLVWDLRYPVRRFEPNSTAEPNA